MDTTHVAIYVKKQNSWRLKLQLTPFVPGTEGAGGSRHNHDTHIYIYVYIILYFPHIAQLYPECMADTPSESTGHMTTARLKQPPIDLIDLLDFTDNF